MKIAILGPVYTKQYFGGVATFDENLAIAYKKISKENEVYLYSKQIKKQFQNSYKINIYPISILSATRQNAFDIIIASLDYAVYLPLMKARKKVYFLHGFFSLSSYTPIKTVFAVMYQKLFLRYADYIIGNSSFTCFINREIYNINSDGSVSLGASYDYIYNLNQNKSIKKEPNSILFTGRLVEAKKIEIIVEAINVLQKRNNQSYILRIVGDGELKSTLVKYVKEYNLNVKFYDRVSQSEIAKFYQMSQIFISLNPSEPFGITFCEALLAGCEIVCPATGGQIEFLSKYPHLVEIIKDVSAATIADAILKLSERDSVDYVDEDDFLYDNTAKGILDIIGEG